MENANEPKQPLFVLRRFIPVVVIVAVCWLLLVINNLVFSGQLNQHGIIPRHISSLPAVIWSPYLHTSARHLAANTLPLLILGAIICGRGKGEFALVTIGGSILGGLLTWLFARTGSHVGASGLIFCFFGYLTSLAYFKRHIGTLLLAVVCLVGYGGMLTGIFPTSAAISWEGHLAGLLSGIALAWGMSKVQKQAEVPEVPSTGSMPPRVRID